jgi:hypothetical protein
LATLFATEMIGMPAVRACWYAGVSAAASTGEARIRSTPVVMKVLIWLLWFSALLSAYANSSSTPSSSALSRIPSSIST